MWLCQSATVCGRVSHQVAPIHGSRWRHQDQALDCQPAYRLSSALQRMDGVYKCIAKDSSALPRRQDVDTSDAIILHLDVADGYRSRPTN